MFENEPEGATPIDPDEAGELLPGHIRTRTELNEWEQQNILRAAVWLRRARIEVLSEEFIRELHRRMFDQTWTWAGTYRRSDKNIGVPWHQVPVGVRNLVKDGRYWIKHRAYPLDEAALRLHHRLVMVHLFPNGNGRHARLWCDTLLKKHGRPPFAWKNRELNNIRDARTAYISALRAADTHHLEPLFDLFLKDRPN